MELEPDTRTPLGATYRKPSRIYAGNEPQGAMHPWVSIPLVLTLLAFGRALEFLNALAGAGGDFRSLPLIELRDEVSLWLLGAAACACLVYLHNIVSARRRSGAVPLLFGLSSSLYAWWLLRWMNLDAEVDGFSSGGIPMSLGFCVLWTLIGTSLVYFLLDKLIRGDRQRDRVLHAVALVAMSAAFFATGLRVGRGTLAPNREARASAYATASDTAPPLSSTGESLNLTDLGPHLLFTAGPASQKGELHACLAFPDGDTRGTGDYSYTTFGLWDCVTLVMFDMPEALERIEEGRRRSGSDEHQGELVARFMRYERPTEVYCDLAADCAVSYLHQATAATRKHLPSVESLCLTVLPRARNSSLSDFFAGRESFYSDIGCVPLELSWAPGTPRLHLDVELCASEAALQEALDALGESGPHSTGGVRLQIDPELSMQQLVDALDVMRERGVRRIAID